MSKTYTVKQGDHLFGIAEENGFHSYSIIWDHPQNAQLKQTRQNPNILFPGDQVFIPDLELREESRSTNQRHKFQVSTEQLQLRLVLEDVYEKPIAGASCNLIVDGDSHKLTSDGSGLIELPIQPDAKKAVLIVDSDETPFENVEIPIKIGHLDPVDKLSGQKARLNNLGYFAGDVGGPADDAFESAVEEFQCDQNLTVDGKCGPATQAKLKQLHGC
ncbi:MAG TPA: peptidoglycan-binding protein [Bryobacteraceae bacterium]|nr:peptidoglycan-binding protein [Bryobacteraceae bacterium]